MLRFLILEPRRKFAFEPRRDIRFLRIETSVNGI